MATQEEEPLSSKKGARSARTKSRKRKAVQDSDFDGEHPVSVRRRMKEQAEQQAEERERASMRPARGGLMGNMAPLLDPAIDEATFKDLQRRTAAQNLTADMERQLIEQHDKLIRATRTRRMAASALVAVSKEIMDQARACYKVARRLESTAVLLTRYFNHFHGRAMSGRATDQDRHLACLAAVHLKRETADLQKVQAMQTQCRALHRAVHEAVNLNRNVCARLMDSKIALAVPAYSGPSVSVTAMPHRAGAPDIVRRRKTSRRKTK